MLSSEPMDALSVCILFFSDIYHSKEELSIWPLFCSHREGWTSYLCPCQYQSTKFCLWTCLEGMSHIFSIIWRTYSAKDCSCLVYGFCRKGKWVLCPVFITSIFFSPTVTIPFCGLLNQSVWLPFFPIVRFRTLITKSVSLTSWLINYSPKNSLLSFFYI